MQQRMKIFKVFNSKYIEQQLLHLQSRNKMPLTRTLYIYIEENIVNQYIQIVLASCDMPIVNICQYS